MKSSSNASSEPDRSGPAIDQDRSALPLTERVLGALPGSAVLWAGIWAAIPLGRAVVYYISLIATGSDPGLGFLGDWLLFSLVPAYLVALSLYSAARLAGELRACRYATAHLADEGAGAASSLTAGAVTPPFLLAAGFTLLVEIAQFDRVGVIAVLDVPLALLVNLAVMTFVWVFIVLLVELDRFGQQRLALGRFPEDLSLGLRPIGSLALTAFVLYAAGGIPILFTLGSGPLDLIGGLVIFLVGVALFFLSMWRLHRQMRIAKAEFLGLTRRLFREAFAPVHSDPSVRALQKHADLLAIAETLQRRAEAIHEWPLDQGMVTRIAVIITGVITGIIVRLILTGAGM